MCKTFAMNAKKDDRILFRVFEFGVNPLSLLLSHWNWSFGSNDNICCQCTHSADAMDPMYANGCQCVVSIVAQKEILWIQIEDNQDLTLSDTI